jgi:alkanesulfonate monooxygenase SsuD/methylene tetrahydromethanopterin reductase-like flavin-dependent oxidoreductase (luciferase family)
MWQGRVIEAGSSEGAAMVGDRGDLVVLLASAGEATEALAENAVAIAAAADRFGESSPQVVALLEQRVAVATAAGEKKEAKKAKKMLKKLR